MTHSRPRHTKPHHTAQALACNSTKASHPHPPPHPAPHPTYAFEGTESEPVSDRQRCFEVMRKFVTLLKMTQIDLTMVRRWGNKRRRMHTCTCVTGAFLSVKKKKSHLKKSRLRFSELFELYKYVYGRKPAMVLHKM